MSHYSRGQITSEAEAIVNNTNLGTISDSILNRILYKLYTNYEWGFLISSTTVSFSSSAASAAVPTDYLGHVHLKYRDTNQSPVYEFNLAWIDYSKYLNIPVPLQTAARPKAYTISPMVRHAATGAVGNILIWPIMDTPLPLTLWYYALPASIGEGSGGDATVPQFQNHAFLVEVLANELYGYMRDPRFDPQFIQKNIGDVRANMLDYGALSVPEIGLDVRRFRQVRGRYGGWGRYG